MNQSIHMVDMLRVLMPPIKAIQAFTSKIGHAQIETEDTAVATLSYRDGSLGVIYGSSASYPGQFRRFELTGTSGTVVQVEDSFTVWQFAEEKQEDQQIREKYAMIHGGGGVSDPSAIPYENHTRNFKDFLKALEDKQPFSIDGGEARKAVELILALYQSAREGGCIELD